MEVADDVRVTETRETLELGVELFAFLLGHLSVVDFFPAEDEAVGLPPDLSDHPEGSLT